MFRGLIDAKHVKGNSNYNLERERFAVFAFLIRSIRKLDLKLLHAGYQVCDIRLDGDNTRFFVKIPDKRAFVFRVRTVGLLFENHGIHHFLIEQNSVYVISAAVRSRRVCQSIEPI